MRTHTTASVTGVDGISRWIQVHIYDDGRTVLAAYSQTPTSGSAIARWSSVLTAEDSQALGMALLGEDTAEVAKG